MGHTGNQRAASEWGSVVTGWTPKRDARRPERILALKAKIDRGDYQVPPERVADAVMAWYRRIEPTSQR